MEIPPAANNRYMISFGFLMMMVVALILKKAFLKSKIPRKELPNFIVKLFSIFDTSLLYVIIDVGVNRGVGLKTDYNCG
ncbi:hypothetical protein AAEU33_20420 [Chryseobacterium sp. Chry.R1]|uniref:hypothetical protein n=1 Tax=Chryseobacterium sp. Chry.R1 TaxID=3139392 RepID=UPI0031F7FA3F